MRTKTAILAGIMLSILGGGARAGDPAPVGYVGLPGDTPDAVSSNTVPRLETYLLPTSIPLGAVIVCPGGGYGKRAPHEGEPVARMFNAAGLHAFVLHYRVAPDRYPAPQRDLARAVRLVRSKAAEWNVDAKHVAICGFSAGGHLVTSLSVLYDEPELNRDQPLATIPCRPDGVIACYPVISPLYGHTGSFKNLLGPEADDATRARFALDKRVTPQTPPTFLWHTAEDRGVPVENALKHADALRINKVPFELHVYQQGPHGMGLAGDDPHVASWGRLACEWLSLNGWVSASSATP